jgi:hypothetical protein
MNILALDLGSTVGWALNDRDGIIRSGTKKCTTSTKEQRGARWSSFKTMLFEVHAVSNDIDVVYYEDVKRHQGVLAAHVYGGFLAHLEHWCALRNIPMVGVGVGTIKKNWTGKGNSDKDAMIAEAKKRGFNPADDNEADSIAILALALKLENETALDITTACPALAQETEGAF